MKSHFMLSYAIRITTLILVACIGFAITDMRQELAAASATSRAAYEMAHENNKLLREPQRLHITRGW